MKIILRILLVTLCISMPMVADADLTQVPFPIPSTLSVVADGKKGELLTPGWIYSARGSMTAPNGADSLAIMAFPTKAFTIAGPHDVNYGVQDASSYVKGAGVAIGAGVSVNGGPWNWVSMFGGTILKIPVKPADRVQYQYAAALVRTGDIVRSGSFDMSAAANLLFIIFRGDMSGDYGVHIGNAATKVEAVNQTCRIDPVPPVNMGDVSSTVFKGVGSASNPTKFGVAMTCPAGFNKVFYQMNPAGGSAVVGDPGAGNISLLSSGASGVAVHIEQDNPSGPVPLGQNVQVPQYDPSKKDQPIDLHFNARYLQTESRVGGGEASAEAVITLSYE